MKIYPSNLNHIRYTKPTNEEIQQEYNFPCSITVLNQALSTAELFYYDGEGNEFPQGRFNIPSDYLFQKALLKTDTAPTTKGLYPLSETGIYTNLGGINAATGKLNFASFDGTTWSKVEVAVAMPEYSGVLNPLEKTKAPSEKAVADFVYEDIYRNLIDFNDLHDGYIRQDIGTLNPADGFKSTGYIRVKSGLRYTTSTLYHQFAFYDENLIFIPDSQSANVVAYLGVISIVPPENAQYIRLTLLESELNNYVFQLNESIIPISNNNIYVKKIGGNFNSIVKAIEYANSKGSRYNIHIEDGVWLEELQLISGVPQSLIGESKKGTIISNYAGNIFETKVGAGWYFENLTFRNVGTGYAVHADYAGAGITEFINCAIETNQGSALGAGSHQDQTLRFRNCDFANYGESIGAPTLFWHNNVASGVTNQRLEVLFCNITSNREQTLRIDDANLISGDNVGNSATVLFFGNSFYSNDWGAGNNNLDARPFWYTSEPYFFGKSIALDPRSYGNNVPKLNK